ncbi:hypothetical protein B0T25DRAFT_361496 [Lasiosphaeria hispida]|uniref:Uncharacterized protein n=1 Tax=Lasiosphaeria hispida TaxID=260671 RepID=A0AAJ0H4Z7_9PEZI|nr:hypothetical protein B0T25DRAFT_361496 [Lasiosphaeria hispida]
MSLNIHPFTPASASYRHAACSRPSAPQNRWPSSSISAHSCKLRCFWSTRSLYSISRIDEVPSVLDGHCVFGRFEACLSWFLSMRMWEAIFSVRGLGVFAFLSSLVLICRRANEWIYSEGLLVDKDRKGIFIMFSRLPQVPKVLGLMKPPLEIP